MELRKGAAMQKRVHSGHRRGGVSEGVGTSKGGVVEPSALDVAVEVGVAGI